MTTASIVNLKEAPPPLRGRSATRSVDGWGVLSPPARWQREGGSITPLPALWADLPLKGGGDDNYGESRNP
jgi:hypothetical protein